MRAMSRLLSGGSLSMAIILMSLSGNALGQTPREGPSQQGSAVPPSETESTSKPAAPAQTDSLETQPAVSDFSILRVAGGFGLVISLIFLAYVGARKFAPQYFAKRPADKNLKLVESLSMGEKRSVSIVEFDERRFLLGNTPGQITLLAELPGRLSIRSDNQPSAALSFAASRHKNSQEQFKDIYEVEKGAPPRAGARHIPPDIRAKMRQLRESLER